MNNTHQTLCPHGNRQVKPNANVTHRAFVAQVGGTDVYTDEEGILTALAVEEGVYTVLVNRLREGSISRDGTGIPTALWRLLMLD